MSNNPDERKFSPSTSAVLTVSDTRTTTTDGYGDMLVQLLTGPATGWR